jgi:hypothetical protein
METVHPITDAELVHPTQSEAVLLQSERPLSEVQPGQLAELLFDYCQEGARGLSPHARGSFLDAWLALSRQIESARQLAVGMAAIAEWLQADLALADQAYAQRLQTVKTHWGRVYAYQHYADEAETARLRADQAYMDHACALRVREVGRDV